MLYADLRDPVALLRGERRRTELAALLALCRRRRRRPALAAEQVAAYTGADGGVAAADRGEVLAAYRFAGIAACSTSAAAMAPSSRSRRSARRTCALMLFDLPAVAVRAQRVFAAAGLVDRAERSAAIS